jgi:HEPN domain-containing protein
MGVELQIANTLRIAKEDLEGARLLASRGNRNAVYLCEQAAEKVIKAVLTSEGKHAGIKHQLDAMVDLVPDENPLKPLLRDIESLTRYATTYRYTTSTGRIPDAPKGSEFDALAHKVDVALAEAASRFGVDLTAQGQPARKPAPIR